MCPATTFDPGAPSRRAWAGIGLKPVHLAGLLNGDHPVDFLEVHAENHMGAGGPALRMLERVRERWPLSIHGVGLSIGGPGPLDTAHLDRLTALVHRFEPHWCSEHLAWSSHGGHGFNDLLPVPYHAGTLQRVCDHIDQVQTRLQRRLLLENPSSYLEFASSTMGEGEFLAEVVRRTGCALLLDVNNAYVSAVNHGRDPWTTIAALPADAVQEIHLAGFSVQRDSLDAPLLIDTHGQAVDEAVWQLFQRTMARLGPVPTLIERDQDLPPLEILAAEADRARTVLQTCAERPRPALAATCPVPTTREENGPDAKLIESFARSLLDPSAPTPPGLATWNGSDPDQRLDVHRNNVMHSLVDALRDTFPVVAALVGTEFFDAMGAAFIRRHPPRTPVLSDWGDALPDWLATFEPAASLPYLSDLARLERARVRAWHAADTRAVDREELVARWTEAAAGHAPPLSLHPSLTLVESPHPVVSLWAAHQWPSTEDIDTALACVDLDQPETALVLRDRTQEVIVTRLSPTASCFIAALQAGVGAEDAAAHAARNGSCDDQDAAQELAQTLSLLIDTGAWMAPPLPTLVEG